MKNTKSIEKRILRFQQDELNGAILYRYVAKLQKDPKNKRTFQQIANDEMKHYGIWREFTGKDLKPEKLRIIFYKLLVFLLGFTFTLKYLENGENFSIQEMESIKAKIPEAEDILADEERHEQILINLLDEDRLHYVGAMVLGLNDALVELTGTIAGLTLALANTKVVALAAIITGAAATLSMAASNYLAERANGSAQAIKSSAYTGFTYLITVILLVLPYLLLPDDMYIEALVIMLILVVLIIFVFNYYTSVAQDLPLWSRFIEMAIISLGVAGISFGIGILAKALLGVEL